MNEKEVILGEMRKIAKEGEGSDLMRNIVDNLEEGKYVGLNRGPNGEYFVDSRCVEQMSEESVEKFHFWLNEYIEKYMPTHPADM